MAEPFIRRVWLRLSGAKRLLRRVVIVTALAYPVALLGAIGLLRFVGEDWWASAVLMYLPRFGFALPLAVLVPALLWLRLYRWLWTQLLASLIVIFPLMGCVVSQSPSRGPGPVLRVLSLNANGGYYGNPNVLRRVREQRPDIVSLVEVADGEGMVALLRQDYPFVELSTEFVLASKFPVTRGTPPEKIPCYGKDRSPRFITFRIETPLGPLQFFTIHPISPRHGLTMLRGRGIPKEVVSGRVFANEEAIEETRETTALRRLQAEAIASVAMQQTLPIIIAGDTNLPDLSAVLAKNFGAFQDGFREVGSGFGYTFPRRLPWMRIDRVFATHELSFVKFEVGCKGVSDHLCVVAELQRSSP